MTVYSLPFDSTFSPNGVRRDMNRLMQEVFQTTRSAVGPQMPRADATEHPHGFTLELELPGISPDRVEVVAEDGVLVVRGGHETREATEGSRVIFAERSVGQFERRFRLPKSADLNAIEATYADGVLTISVPKVAPAQPRRVQVTVDQRVRSASERQSVGAGSETPDRTN